VQLDDKKRIYFLAICGTAMASLAAMMKAKGYEVYGSDEGVYPPMSDFLAEQGIAAFEGFDAAHLDPRPDLVIVGNVISRGNVEIEEILDQHIPYMSLPEALREFLIRGNRSIVVTGTHGKTTTSSMLSWLFESANRKPSFMIGGIPKNFGRGFQLGAGEDFILEGDEYDSAYFDKAAKFLRYLPDIAIINGIEFDHADIYSSLDDIKLAFQRFVNLIPGKGLLAVNGEDADAVEISERAFCPVVTFGVSESVDWRAVDIETTSESTQFIALHRGVEWARISIQFPGEHNVRNALACIAIGTHLGIDKKALLDGLASFEGVKRRLDLVGVANDIDIYDDFGHHPTAIKETLAGFRAKHNNRRIWALYEPRSATSRRNIFQHEFVDAFESADAVLIAPVHRPDKAPPDQLFSCEQLVKDLRNRDKISEYLDINDMVRYLGQHAQKDDVIITFSNGPFGGIHDRLLNSL
jgi:UDP-N-acetylmuramate: L-alanyl-gamma-D-glutamyl-meso-diaminopimelate ligase